jgi:hypothetical protein
MTRVRVGLSSLIIVVLAVSVAKAQTPLTTADAKDQCRG